MLYCSPYLLLMTLGFTNILGTGEGADLQV